MRAYRKFCIMIEVTGGVTRRTGDVTGGVDVQVM